jgi:transcriptional accessory protein Tex/SPT6
VRPFPRLHVSAASRTLKDLKPGMILEGTVTNVAAFGAFVDVGVQG